MLLCTKDVVCQLCALCQICNPKLMWKEYFGELWKPCTGQLWVWSYLQIHIYAFTGTRNSTKSKVRRSAFSFPISKPRWFWALSTSRRAIPLKSSRSFNEHLLHLVQLIGVIFGTTFGSSFLFPGNLVRRRVELDGFEWFFLWCFCVVNLHCRCRCKSLVTSDDITHPHRTQNDTSHYKQLHSKGRKFKRL